MEYPCRFINCPQNLNPGSVDNEQFYTKLGYVTSLYSYLQFNFSKSPYLMYRNLSFLRNEKSNLKRLRHCDLICDYLRKKNDAINGKECNHVIERIESPLCDEIFSIYFLGFHDSCQEFEWETINASVDVFVVHQWRKCRKSQSGRKWTKLFEGLHILCNSKPTEMTITDSYSFRKSQLFQDTDDLRIVYSYILFKFRVLEKRICDSPGINDEDKKDPRYGVYAVNYEAKLPFYKLNCDDKNYQMHLLPGDYEMRVEVSTDQPSEQINEEMDLESIADQLSDSSERFWVADTNSQTTCVKEYNKWPRILFKLESSLKDTQSHNIKAALSNGIVDHVPKPAVKAAQNVSVAYKFFHKDQLLQWTHLRSLKCPWCSFCRPRSDLNLSFNVLLMHLQTFHCRLSVKCRLIPPSSSDCDVDCSSMVVSVTLNQCYDGSVEIGSRSWAGRTVIDRPERKLQFTHIIYCTLMERINAKVKDTSIDMRPLINGHNRLYITSTTGIYKSVKDMDLDSEGEDNPSWLRQMYDKRIEEFTDVNPGEKRIMQLWNCHLLDHKYNGDYMVPTLTRSFIVEKGFVMKAEDLRHNLLLHIANLVDYGLLTQRQLIDVMDIFDHLPSAMSD